MAVMFFRAGGKPVNVQYITEPQSSSGVAVSGKCAFGGIIVKTDGINDVTVNVYDNTTNSGKKLIPDNVVVKGSSGIDGLGYDPPVYAEKGIYVEVVTSGTCSWQVLYDKG